jgi:glycosyltransferase involved in cell wall biosynthesis
LPAFAIAWTAPEMTGRRLKVVMFAPHFAEYALRAAIGLAQGADVLAIFDTHVLDREVSPVLGLTHPNVTIHAIDFGVRGQSRFDFPGLVAAIDAFAPDIIHHQEQLPQVSLALMARFRATSAQVLMVHDPQSHGSAVYALDAATRSLILRTRRAADRILVHGPVNETQLRATDPDLTVPVSHTQHGVMLVPPPALLRAPEPRRVLMFGWMVEHKGVDVAVAAATILNRGDAPVTFHLAGSGSEPAHQRESIAAAGNIVVDDRFLPPEEAIAAFQRSALAILPYREGTQSGVLASALGNGRPAIVSRVGDFPGLVTDGVNGFVVRPGDAAALAAAIARALDTPGLVQELAAGARTTTATLMDWDRIGAATLAIYADLLAKRSPRS